MAGALKRYTQEVSITKKPTTQRSEHFTAQHLDAFFGKYSMAAVSAELVAKYRDKRLADGKSNNTVRIELAMLGHLFRTAIQEWGIGLYYVVLAVFAFAFWLIHRTIHSPFGQILKAIRENEARVVSLGYEVERYKLMAFVLSAALAGLAGALQAVVFRFATLADASWQTSGEVVLMTLLGGMGTVVGPVIGAATVATLHNTLADKVGPLLTVIMGVIFVVCVLLFRRGIAGECARLYRTVVGNRPRESCVTERRPEAGSAPVSKAEVPKAQAAEGGATPQASDDEAYRLFPEPEAKKRLGSDRVLDV